MATATFPSPRATTWSLPSQERFAISRVKASAVWLVVLTAVALSVRVLDLSTYGLSEDEINKVQAIEQYRHGHFGANAEHPMLMKLAMWASLELTGAWNRVAPSGYPISIEAAVRLPNAVAGGATTAVLFRLADLLFGARVAAAASLFWALDVNAIAVNRIGKEDTFLLFFFVLGICCYEHAKRLGTVDPAGAQRWFMRGGVSFGLMLASKYMPHYLAIYAVFNGITDRNPGANRPHIPRYYGAMAAAFVLANVAVLMPDTWAYCIRYVQGATLAHHGYLFAGQLYVTNIPISPLGVPAGFYIRLLGTKVPLVILGGTVAGLIELVRRHQERGFTLLRVWVTFFLVPYSLMAAKFVRYALPLFLAVDIIAGVGVVAGIGWLLRKSWLSRTTRVAVAIAAGLICVAGPSIARQSGRPFYSLYRNGAGERLAGAGVTFPEETYDFGVREAVAAIAQVAEPSAIIVSDSPAVVTYYVRTGGRTDLTVRSLSQQGIPYGAHPSWVIVQDEHMTFENRDVVAELRRHSRPWRELYAGDALAAQVFHIQGR
jgi:hypothetical protein